MKKLYENSSELKTSIKNYYYEKVLKNLSYCHRSAHSIAHSHTVIAERENRRHRKNGSQ